MKAGKQGGEVELARRACLLLCLCHCNLDIVHSRERGPQYADTLQWSFSGIHVESVERGMAAGSIAELRTTPVLCMEKQQGNAELETMSPDKAQQLQTANRQGYWKIHVGAENVHGRDFLIRRERSETESEVRESFKRTLRRRHAQTTLRTRINYAKQLPESCRRDCGSMPPRRQAMLLVQQCSGSASETTVRQRRRGGSPCQERYLSCRDLSTNCGYYCCCPPHLSKPLQHLLTRRHLIYT